MKSTLRSAFALIGCALFLASPAHGSEKSVAQKIEKHVNQIARICSATSIGLWLPITMRAIDRYGFINATIDTYTLRLGIDAACIAASHNKNSIALNLLALAGSIASLAYWAPLAAIFPTPLMLSRVALDTTQMGLCAQRLYQIYNKPPKNS